MTGRSPPVPYASARRLSRGSPASFPTGKNDLARLKRRLRELQQRNGFVSDPDDPRAVANELLAIEWSLR